MPPEPVCPRLDAERICTGIPQTKPIIRLVSVPFLLSLSGQKASISLLIIEMTLNVATWHACMICVRTVCSVNNTVTDQGIRRGIDVDAVAIRRVESLVRWVPQPNAAISAHRLHYSFLRRFVLSLSWQYHGFEFIMKA